MTPYDTAAGEDDGRVRLANVARATPTVQHEQIRIATVEDPVEAPDAELEPHSEAVT
jgi:hypothetical protein